MVIHFIPQGKNGNAKSADIRRAANTDLIFRRKTLGSLTYLSI